MKESTKHCVTDRLDHAMAAYILNAVVAKTKNKKTKVNMEYRRKLEIKWEENRLKHNICEYIFD